jgi:hypothetical protein
MEEMIGRDSGVDYEKLRILQAVGTVMQNIGA